MYKSQAMVQRPNTFRIKGNCFNEKGIRALKFSLIITTFLTDDHSHFNFKISLNFYRKALKLHKISWIIAERILRQSAFYHPQSFVENSQQVLRKSTWNFFSLNKTQERIHLQRETRVVCVRTTFLHTFFK